MSDDHHAVKTALLEHVREMFQEIEADLARSHEERYAMLEDVLENASDASELKVAFSQWFAEHSDELELEYDLHETWDHAMERVDFE